jgi:hypothetical protein
MIADRPHIRDGFRIRHIHKVAVGQYSAAHGYLEITVRNCLSAETELENAVLVLHYRTDPRVQQFFMIIVELLKVVRGQEHPLVPDDLAVFAHIRFDDNSRPSFKISKRADRNPSNQLISAQMLDA